MFLNIKIYYSNIKGNLYHSVISHFFDLGSYLWTSGLCCSAVSTVTTNLMDRKQKLYYLVDFDGLRLNIAVLFFYI